MRISLTRIAPGRMAHAHIGRDVNATIAKEESSVEKPKIVVDTSNLQVFRAKQASNINIYLKGISSTREQDYRVAFSCLPKSSDLKLLGNFKPDVMNIKNAAQEAKYGPSVLQFKKVPVHEMNSLESKPFKNWNT